MTKALLFTWLLLASGFPFQTSQASEPFALICMTSPLTTSFSATQEGGKVRFTLIHHHGPAYAPIHRGIITGADLDTMLERARVIKEVGSSIETEWPAESCSVSEKFVIRCANSDLPKQKINGGDFQPYSFDTSVATVKSGYGKFEKLQLDLDFEFNGSNVRVPMSYELSECYFGTGAALKGKDLRKALGR